MASFITNRGKFNAMNAYLKNATEPTQFYLVLTTSSVTPTVDTNLFSDLANEIPAGNGYTSGGLAVTRDATGWPTATEDDTNDWALFTLQDCVFTASGGSLPGSGTGARWGILTDDNATLNSREVIGAFDLASNRIATVGLSISLSGFKLKGA